MTMILSRPPAAALLRCCPCRTRILAPFLPYLLSAAPQSSHRPSQRPSSRLYSESTVAPINGSTAGMVPPTEPDGPGSESESGSGLDAPDPDVVPWYLQLAPPCAPVTHTVAPPPALPPNPPAILDGLVRYLYEEMGLDDMALLDLRALDAPPALGPNLIMLFGTARSERHLHVASGQLVGWLRRTHRVYAKAAGPISRSELKVKLRRANRKARLIGPSRSVLRRVDDGITTGWICINLGTLGAPKGDPSSPRFDAAGRQSGFGGPGAGTTLVVQAMTQERRQDLALETHWKNTLAKNDSFLHLMNDGVSQDKGRPTKKDRVSAPARAMASKPGRDNPKDPWARLLTISKASRRGRSRSSRSYSPDSSGGASTTTGPLSLSAW